MPVPLWGGAHEHLMLGSVAEKAELGMRGDFLRIIQSESLKKHHNLIVRHGSAARVGSRQCVKI